jgi:hypothetical protein
MLPGIRYDRDFQLLPEGYIPPKIFGAFDNIPLGSNPLFGGRLQLNFYGFQVDQQVRVQLRDVRGAMVFQAEQSGPFVNQIVFETGLAAGMYVLEVYFDNQPLLPERVVVVHP